MPSRKEKLHLEAVKRFELASSDPDEQRESAINDSLFVNKEGGQWDDNAKAKRANRPRYTIDRISGALSQVIGDQRQIRISNKVIPQKDGSVEIANIFTSLIRAKNQEASAIEAHDQAFDEGLTGGYGGWRIITKIVDEMSFEDEQDVEIKGIASAASSMYPDPNARLYTKSDGRYWFIIEYMTPDEFKNRWPKAQIQSFDTPLPEAQSNSSWFNEDLIKVAEYWFKDPIKKEIGLLSDGRVIDLKEEKAVLDELKELGITVEKTKIIDSHIVKTVIMSGAEFLTDVTEWAGSFIPIIPYYGKQATVANHKFVKGMVRPAKDAQRIYNYTTSAGVEATALTPKDPYFMTPKMYAKYSEQWRTFNTKNPPVMLYDADTDAPGPPQRGGSPSVQGALIQQVAHAAIDIHATTGLEPASLGNVPELKSGKAIEAQQKMGDRGSFIFTDNLKKSLAFEAEILIDLFPRIYDTERVVQMMGVDGNSESVFINQATDQFNEPILDEETGKKIIVNDLSKGKYSVKVTTGPAHATQRQQTAAQLISLAGQSELINSLSMDIVVKNLDINEGGELTKRVRASMIKKGIVQPTEEEQKELGLDQPPKEDPMNTSLIKNLDAQTEKISIEGEKTISQARNIDADTQKKIFETQKISVDALTSSVESLLKKISAGLPATEQDVNVVKGQKVIVEETQENILEKNEFVETSQLGKPALTQTPTSGQLGQNTL